MKGRPLAKDGLSSALTHVAGYRRTICAIGAEAHLLRVLRGETDPLDERAAALLKDQHAIAEDLITQLHQDDFEVFVDLLFTRGGWQRVSRLGGRMPDVDLIVEQPITGERAWVQVKSKVGQAEFLDNFERFERNGSLDRFFFASHTGTKRLTLPDDERAELLDADKLARRAVGLGLFSWLADYNR